MTTQQEIESLLDEISQVLDEIAAKQQRQKALQEVDQARHDYQILVAEESEEQAKNEQEKKRLEAELRSRNRRVEIMDMDWLPRADAGTLRNRRRFPDRRRPGMRPFVPSPASSGREASLAERRRLKKMVNRWAFRWNLDAARLGQINRIADDAERPLGEALALLRWEQYQTPIPGESGATHLDRLILWREALVEYRDQLAGEVDTLETRYRRWLGIHEQWKARGTEEGQAAWDLFMSRTRQAMLEEIKRLDAEIKDLEAQLANPGGGS